MDVRWKRRLGWVGRVFLPTGIGLLGCVVATGLYTLGFQTYHNLTFIHSSRNTVSEAATSSYKPHSVIGRIEIPRLELSAMIVEGVEDRDLFVGVGRVPETALPGKAGNIAIAGHRDTFFRPLRFIKLDDLITLTTLNGSYSYVVISTEITDPSDTAPLRESSEPLLTLISCYPFTYIGPAPERFVVRAKLVE